MKHKSCLFLGTIAIVVLQNFAINRTARAQNKPTSYQLAGPARTAMMARISVDTAVKLTSNYLNHPQLSAIFKGLALGGTFPKKFFNVSPDSSGIIFWFCYKGGSNPEFFVALEQLKVYSLAKLPNRPTSPSLRKSNGLFRYSLALSARKDVKSYFVAHTNTATGYENVPNAKIQGYVTSFDSLMNANLDSNGERYCKYLYCYFDKNNDFDPVTGYKAVPDYNDFLKQTPDNGFVRYYFGFDQKDKPNRIRVELFSADATGKTITSKPGSLTTNADVLQRSFPPPPYN